MSIDVTRTLSAPLSKPPPTSRRLTEHRDLLEYVGLIALAVLAALLLAGALLAAAGDSATAAFTHMLKGSFGSMTAITTTLDEATPVLAVAIGAVVAGRAGVLNIGQEGQLCVGAMAGAAVGLKVHGPGPLMIGLVLLASALGGALWAGIAAWMRYVRNVNETISTLLLNFVAFEILSYVVSRPWLLQEHFTGKFALAANPVSDNLPANTQLPALVQGEGYLLTSAVLVAVLLAVAGHWALTRSSWGFRLRSFGANPRAAQAAGVSAGVTGGGALMISGAAAGLGGGLLLVSLVPFLQPAFSNNYGWDGLLVGLVAGFRMLPAVVVAIVFGALRAGGGQLEATGVSSTIVGVVQGLIIFAVVLPGLYLAWRRRTSRLSLSVPTPRAAQAESVGLAGEHE